MFFNDTLVSLNCTDSCAIKQFKDFLGSAGDIRLLLPREKLSGTRRGKDVPQRSRKGNVFMPLTIILHVGEDPLLLESRTIILRSAGYVVESVRSLKQAADHFLAGDFDLVILCHSIPSKDRDRLTCWIRASGSHTPVCSISDNPGQWDEFADANLERDPKKLLAGIKAVLGKAPRGLSRSAMPDGNGDAGSATAKTWRGTILCIDDEPNLLILRRRMLENAGYLVLTTDNGSDGLKIFSTGIVDAVLLDYTMPMMNGAAVAAQMRQIKGDVPLILLSGCSTIPEEDYALFDRFIQKGSPPNALLSAIEEVISAPDKQKIARQPAESRPTDPTFDTVM
jgi:DNA-binding response OmpR family regulator